MEASHSSRCGVFLSSSWHLVRLQVSNLSRPSAWTRGTVRLGRLGHGVKRPRVASVLSHDAAETGRCASLSDSSSQFTFSMFLSTLFMYLFFW